MSLLPVFMQYSPGKTCFFVSVRNDGLILDMVNKTWVTYNAPDIANYVRFYSEVIPNIYRATYPSDLTLDVLPTEFSFQRAGVSPDLSVDTPININQSQGQNLGGIVGDPLPAANLAASAGGMETATVLAGANTTTTAVVDLDGATDDLYVGRVVLFTSGDASKAAAIITAFDVASGLLTFTGIAVAPSPGDTLVVV